MRIIIFSEYNLYKLIYKYTLYNLVKVYKVTKIYNLVTLYIINKIYNIVMGKNVNPRKIWVGGLLNLIYII